MITDNKIKKKAWYKGLRRTKKDKPREEFNIGTFDIETSGLGGDFLVGCVGRFIGDHNIFTTATAMLKYMLKYPGITWYAHNGGKYDFLYIVPDLLSLSDEYNIEVTRQGDKIIAFSLELLEEVKLDKNGKHMHNKNAISIRDSLPLVNSSLYAFSKSFAPEMMKLKGDVDFAGGEIFDPSNEKHMSYLHRDTDSLLLSLENMFKLCYDMFGCYPTMTAGGTAMKIWKTTISEGHSFYRLKPNKEEFCRNGYKGGYVYVGHDIEEHANTASIDVNAMYGYAMGQGVPGGASNWTGYFQDVPGFWLVRVTTPANVDFPILSTRINNGSNLVWPTGTFETTVTTPEFLYANEKGYKLEVIEGLIFERLEFPFAEILTQCQDIERTKDPLTGKVDPARKSLAKQLRNSLYGKFGTKLVSEVIKFGQFVPENGKMLMDNSGMPLDGIYSVEEPNDSEYLLSHIAAYITANARLKLFRSMDAIGGTEIIYCDTDSIKAPRVLIDAAIARGEIEIHPTTYGCFKDECADDGDYEMFQCLGPKTYHYTQSGKHHIKAKGAPASRLAELDYCPLCEAAIGIYQPIMYRSMNSVISTIKNSDIPIFTERNRRISRIEKSFAWICDPITKKIVPVHLNQ